MRPRSALFPYQRLAIERALAQHQLALLLAPGDGKTVISMTALADQGAWPALVVAPASVVEADVWGAEARQWAHLSSLKVTPLVGTQRQREKLLKEDSHIEVVSYENLRWLTSEVPSEKRYAALVLDELSKLKDPGTRRFKRMRGRSGRIPIRYGLTGTPVGNHLLDLWGEMFMVAGEKPLGPRFEDFTGMYFEPIDYQRRVWRLKCCPKCWVPGEGGRSRGCLGEWVHCKCHRDAVEDIQRRTKPYAFALRPGTGAVKPPVLVRERVLPMPAEAERISQELMRQLYAILPNGATLEALSQSSIAAKLRQLAGGAVYYGTADEEGNPTGDIEWEEVHTAKLDALDDLLDELQGQPALVFYWYKHEAVRIKRRLAGRRWVDFANDPKAATELWNRGGAEVMLMHPQSAGFGLNLQAGGSRVIWYSIPWSNELFVQGNGRLARPGQKAPWVGALRLLCGPADAMVAAALDNKGEVEKSFMNAMGD